MSDARSAEGTLRLLEPDEQPQYGGLWRDRRGIVVGRQGIVCIAGIQRCAAFLAVLSHVADLSAGVQVEHEPDNEHCACPVTLTPPQVDSPPSLFYDAVQGALAAARLGAQQARLCVGDGHCFVPYAHAAAPHGYDVQDTPPEQGRVLLLPEGTRTLHELQPAPLLDMLCDVPLLPTRQPQPPHTLAVLTDRRLVATVADYAQRHGLAYTVRFLDWQRDSEPVQVALFDMVTAGEVRPLPGFVCDFLRRLPRTVLLTDALEPADLEHEPPRRVLVAWGYHTPLYLPHMQELLPDRALLLLAGSSWGWALLDTPPPRQPMHHLARAQIAAPARIRLSDQPASTLTLRMALLRDDRPRGPVEGLLLDETGLHRLRRIVRHLPGPLFAHVRVALGDGVALLVTADASGTIAGLPLGQPLTRAEPPELLLPRGLHLRPTVPPDLLVPALGLQPDTLTVLTPTCRYDVALEALQPLASLLVLDAPAHTQSITLQASTAPPLDLGTLEEPPKPEPVNEPAEPRTEDQKPGAEDREPKRGNQEVLYPDPQSPTSAHIFSFEDELRQRAAQLEQAGDHATAAIFYDYLGDDAQAAACYQRVLARPQERSL